MGKVSNDASGDECEALCRLLEAVRAGNQPAFARLVSQYEGLLRNRAAAFGSQTHEVEEAYQEACLALHRAAMRYRFQDKVTFGLYAKICMDNALKTKYKRDSRKKVRASAETVDFVPFDESRFFAYFSDPVIEEESAEALLSLIRAELSAYERQVFDLYIQKLSSAEIAARLGRDEKSIRNAIGRLLKKLRKRLGR